MFDGPLLSLNIYISDKGQRAKHTISDAGSKWECSVSLYFFDLLKCSELKINVHKGKHPWVVHEDEVNDEMILMFMVGGEWWSRLKHIAWK